MIEETKQKGESLEGLWQELEEKAMYLNQEIEYSWPCEKQESIADKYPYPYQITNWDWKLKENKEQIKDDNENVIYEIQNEFSVVTKK